MNHVVRAILILVATVLAWPATAQTHVRRDVQTLTPQQITDFKNGVRVMKSRAATDPTSWLYQANIHGTYDTPVRNAWNTCQHGSYLFLSWHRMYLYYFERILRKASGNPNFALPYWNYSVPAQANLPVIFRQPANTTNVLWVAQRSPSINNGAFMPASVTSYQVAFASTIFSTPQGNGNSFGGQRVPGAVHFSSPHGLIERQPHDIVHVTVGGNGWMSDPNLAARDPIFWLHHANIDRLWKRWLAQGGGRANPPTSDTVWYQTKFTFFDENGTAVTMTGAQIINTVTQLGYRYDDDPFIFVPRLPPIILASAEAGEPVIVASAAPPSGLTLKGERVDVDIAVPENERPHISAAAAPTSRQQLFLNLEGIRYDKPHGTGYEVYVNLPADATAPEANGAEVEHFVGTLALFTLMPHHGPEDDAGATARYDITGLVDALRADNRWDATKVRVTLRPVQLLAADGTAFKQPVVAAAAAALADSNARIARISLSVE